MQRFTTHQTKVAEASMADQTATGVNAAKVVPAATVLLVRDLPAFEVLMVKRHHQIDFASGALVFPGGKTHAADDNPEWTRYALGWTETPPDERALRIAAIREAYEEAGILLARHADGSSFCGEERAAAARAAIVENPGDFLKLVATLGLKLDLDALTVFSRWVTPSMMPKRFDTWFFLAAAPPDQLAVCDGWETVDAEWMEPREALRLGESGERTVIFPTRMNLQLLAEATTTIDAVARAQTRPRVTVEPKVAETPSGRVLVIPPDAGYGEVSQPLSALTESPRSRRELFGKHPFVKASAGVEQHRQSDGTILGHIDANDAPYLHIIRHGADRAFIALKNLEGDLGIVG